MINDLESLNSLTGHPEPLSALHARMVAPLRRFFRSYRLNAADIDDFTQEVFARPAGLGRQKNLLKPEAFVFTLARNLVRDRARRPYAKSQFPIDPSRRCAAQLRAAHSGKAARARARSGRCRTFAVGDAGTARRRYSITRDLGTSIERLVRAQCII